MIRTILCMAFGGLLGTTTLDAATDEVRTLTHALDRLMVPAAAASRGRHYHRKTCESAPMGCHVRLGTFAMAFSAAGREFGVDPWLLASMAITESNLDPWAAGPRGELGVIRFHRTLSKTTKMAIEPKACRLAIDECQAEVVGIAAALMERWLERRGNERDALASYAVELPHGQRGYGYADAVLRVREKLQND